MGQELDLFTLDGQVALVTGGGSGIGRTYAETLSEAGATVVLLGRTLEKVENTAAEIKQKTGVEVGAYSCDVTAKDKIESVVAQIVNKYERIDILVNNAGTSVRSNLEELDESEWDKVMDTNVKSIFFMSQTVTKYMKKQNYGRIINTASVAGSVSLFFSTVYGTSKAGAIHLTKQLSSELAPYNITVNAISPWFFKTDLNKSSLENDEFKGLIENRTPMKRIGQLEELKTTVLYFASKHSSYTTGQNMNIDGGMVHFGV